MASVRTYTWKTGDTMWGVAARYMLDAGWSDISSFVAAIRQANLGAGTANIQLWGQNPLTGQDAIAAGTIITLPHATH